MSENEQKIDFDHRPTMSGSTSKPEVMLATNNTKSIHDSINLEHDVRKSEAKQKVPDNNKEKKD